ncbi:MAG: hypothetical protein NTNFB02_34080 [Nitrospira sp.]
MTHHCTTRSVLCLALALALLCPDIIIATDLPIYGSLGGQEFRAVCPTGSYLVGLAGRAGGWVDRIAPICAPWLKGSRIFGSPTVGQFFGFSGGGQERQTACGGGSPDNHAIQSWSIRLRSDNHFVEFITMFCTSLTVPVASNSGRNLDFGAKPVDAEEVVTSGPFSNVHPSLQACPAGEVGIGIRGPAGKYVDAIGLICGPLPVKVGAPVTKLPGPLVQAPSPAVTMSPQAKNMRIPEDMFVITKPAVGDRVPQGQLVVTATLPKIGMTNVTELELRFLDAPPNQRDSYPYLTVFSVDTPKLLQGYPVAERVTGYLGRWQVRARSSMKAASGPWSFPVQFELVKAQAPPPMVQLPKLNAPITQAPAPNTGTAPMMVRPPTTSSQGTGSSSLMIRPRGVDELEKKEIEEKKP